MRSSWRPIAIVLVVVTSGCAGVDDSSATSRTAPVETSTGVTLAFEHPDLSGPCEDVDYEVVEGEASPWKSRQEAVDGFVQEASILSGLDLADGAIKLNGEEVGTYDLVERPENTFLVLSGRWCFTG